MGFVGHFAVAVAVVSRQKCRVSIKSLVVMRVMYWRAWNMVHVREQSKQAECQTQGNQGDVPAVAVAAVDFAAAVGRRERKSFAGVEQYWRRRDWAWAECWSGCYLYWRQTVKRYQDFVVDYFAGCSAVRNSQRATWLSMRPKTSFFQALLEQMNMGVVW